MTDVNQLQSQLASLENTTEAIPAEQVRELVSSIRDLFGDRIDQQADGNSGDQHLFAELGELAKFINTAKKELRDAESGKLAEQEIPDASVQLDEIIKMTEQATTRIMDCCERLQATQNRLRDRLLSAEPPLDPELMAGVDDALMENETSVTQIFEACNFQDVTGQRIQKVVKTLQEIERQVLRMLVVFGLNQKDTTLDDSTREALVQDAELLNGPALPGQGLEQDDIDALLSKLL